MPFEVARILTVVLFIILFLSSIFMVVVVLFQSGNQDGLGAITGQQESYFGKNKGKTLENRLKRATMIVAGLMLVCAIMLLIITSFWYDLNA